MVTADFLDCCGTSHPSKIVIGFKLGLYYTIARDPRGSRFAVAHFPYLKLSWVFHTSNFWRYPSIAPKPQTNYLYTCSCSTSFGFSFDPSRDFDPRSEVREFHLVASDGETWQKSEPRHLVTLGVPSGHRVCGADGGRWEKALGTHHLGHISTLVLVCWGAINSKSISNSTDQKEHK